MMGLSVAVILLLSAIAVNAAPTDVQCCFADMFQGRERVLGDNRDIFYRADFVRNTLYQTFDDQGRTYNITDLTTNKVYVVTTDGCTIVDSTYKGLYKQCYGTPDEIVKFGDSTFSYDVKTYTTTRDGMTYTFAMQHRDGQCIPLMTIRDVQGQRVVTAFFYDFDAPFPPSMDTVKAMCT